MTSHNISLASLMLIDLIEKLKVLPISHNFWFGWDTSTKPSSLTQDKDTNH